MATKRNYRLKKRGELMAETRRRIVEATVDLHRTVGPAGTHVNEIANRAGVQRVTVYSHFPDEAALFAACSAHWRSLHPAPDPAEWHKIADPSTRRRIVLAAVFGWFRGTEPMTAKVLRDMDLRPALRPIVEGGLYRYLAVVRQLLVETTKARGAAKKRVTAVVCAVLDLHTWRALAPLGDKEAAELAAGLIEFASKLPSKHS